MEKHDEGICKMSEILGDTGKRVSGGRALLLCICHECGSNFEIQRRRFSQLKPCLRCLRKKQKAYEPFYAKIEELEHEIERLNKFCKEFIYGEDNPKYYKTMDEKIAEKEARILENMGEEINRLRAELNNSKNFHCPHYLTNDSGGVSCHRDFEKEIASLKEQLAVITPLRRVLAVTRMANRNNPDIRVTMALNDWDKLTKEIKK